MKILSKKQRNVQLVMYYYCFVRAPAHTRLKLLLLLQLKLTSTHCALDRGTLPLQATLTYFNYNFNYYFNYNFDAPDPSMLGPGHVLHNNFNFGALSHSALALSHAFTMLLLNF